MGKSIRTHQATTTPDKPVGISALLRQSLNTLPHRDMDRYMTRRLPDLEVFESAPPSWRPVEKAGPRRPAWTAADMAGRHALLLSPNRRTGDYWSPAIPLEVKVH